MNLYIVVTIAAGCDSDNMFADVVGVFTSGRKAKGVVKKIKEHKGDLDFCIGDFDFKNAADFDEVTYFKRDLDPQIIKGG